MIVRLAALVALVADACAAEMFAEYLMESKGRVQRGRGSSGLAGATFRRAQQRSLGLVQVADDVDGIKADLDARA